jgi:hypothetical protein
MILVIVDIIFSTYLLEITMQTPYACPLGGGSVVGWGLIFIIIIAAALVLYFAAGIPVMVCLQCY